MLSKRLESIINRIVKKDSVIVDVGCDHCYTSIYALKSGKVEFAYNIDINSKPLECGIKNLIEEDLIDKTNNFICDGLRTDKITRRIDYCIISGLGGNTIVEILSNSTVKSISEYILVCNDHPEKVREYIKDNHLKISYEEMIYEKNFFYSLIQISKKGKLVKTEEDILFGPINRCDKTSVFKEYLIFLLNKYQKIYASSYRLAYNTIILKIKNELL